MKIKILLTVAVAALMLPTTSAKALPVELYSFTGTLHDAVGRPIPGVVSDGTRSASAGADGRYRLVESVPGTYTLRASTAPTESAQQSAALVLPEEKRTDFTLLYRISGSATPNQVPTGGVIDLEVRATAPSPEDPAGSCLRLTDVRTGEAVDHQFVGVSGQGTAVWNAELHVESAAPNTYAVEAEVVACGTTTAVTRQVNIPYTVLG